VGKYTRIRVSCWLVMTVISGWIGAHYFPVQRLLECKSETLNPTTTPHIAAPQLSAPFGHPYYPYSVIPGGAHTREELQRALASDSTAAKHYSDFVVKTTRIVTLDKDRQYYVSYRVGDKVYWTHRAVTIRRGEQLLFDGVHYARARCGNRLSEVSAKPLLALSEPNPQKFEVPVPIQVSLSMQVPHIESGPYLRFEVAMTRIQGLPEPLNNLVAPYVPPTNVAAPQEPPSNLAAPYVSPETKHPEDPTLQPTSLSALNGPEVVVYSTELPSSAVVPEPTALHLLSIVALAIGAIAAYQRVRERGKARP
jgi:hypothetical protein